MKWELPDNAKEAFQFLSIGALVVIGIRLIVVAISLLSDNAEGDPLLGYIAAFRNGYPLLDRHTLVIGGLAMIPRLAVAALFTVFTGLLVATCAASFMVLAKHSALKGAVRGARTGCVIGGAWAIYTLLLVPPKSVLITDNGLSLKVHWSFLRTIPIPFTSTQQEILWPKVEGIEHDPSLSVDHPCDALQQVKINVGGNWTPIARLMDDPALCTDGYNPERTEAMDLVTALEPYLNRR